MNKSTGNKLINGRIGVDDRNIIYDNLIGAVPTLFRQTVESNISRHNSISMPFD